MRSPGSIVLEPELAAVQMRHRRREAQPEAGAWLRAALLEPHEALDARARGRPRECPGRDRPRVSRMRSPVGGRLDHDFGLCAFGACAASGAAYLMALSTRLASAWLTSSRLPRTGAAAGASTRSTRPLSSASGS